MPGFDRTGPQGRGSRTGRGMGVCPPDTGEETTGQINETETQGQNIPPAQAAQAPYGAPFAFGAGRGRGLGARQAGVIYGAGRGGIPRGCGRGFCGGRMRRGLF